MSYLNRAQDPARKATALTATIAVHAVIAVVLVTGLRYTGMIETVERKPIIEFKTPPEPPPPEPDKNVPEVPRQDFVAPTPPIDLTPVTPIQPKEFDPLVIPDPVVPVRPTPNLVEKPLPQPSFAPRRAAPRNDVSRWVLTEDYPSRPLREGFEGVAGFRVVVGTDGRVDACEITSSSGNAQLDEATCKFVTRRARFDPASDGNGQKVVGSYSSTVRWRIPD